MQTFLPYPDFAQSAACLDRMRLGKQRVEVLQLLKALRSGGAWSNHPACKMWKDNRYALVLYGRAICTEWKKRGYKDTCLERISAYSEVVLLPTYVFPSWLGNEAFHLSHQSNLIRKLPEHYGPMFPGVSNNLPYVWPGA